ncbi:MAG TPA: SPOR domain-containing protein [Acidobacteriaceae bacterium]|nr:SPOR domain-containing protein [Acidobacteriaceae bacterium]
MSGLLNELDEREDHEITLGTGALLAIFFGVVLVCAVFFGLGYSLGRRSGEAPTAVTPAAGKTQVTASQPAVSDSDSSPDPDAPTADKPSTTPSAAIATRVPAKAAPTKAEADTAEAAPTPVVKPVPPKQPPAASSTGGQTMVQLMAAAQSEDAEVLAAALRKRGYHAIVRNEPDHLYHVQIGPFASRAEADAMRVKLQADGYNAILK